LHRVSADRAEATDVARENPEIVTRLTQLALTWKATLPSTVDPSCISNADRQATPAAPPAGVAPGAPARKAPVDRAAAFARMDTNRDGILTLEEYVAGLKGAPNLDQRFKNFDKNGDGKLSREEFIGAPSK
jgi:hypothetical protein